MTTFRLGIVGRSFAARLSPQSGRSFAALREQQQQPRLGLVRCYASPAGSSSSAPQSTVRLALKAMAVGALLGTGWSGYTYFKGDADDHKIHEKTEPTFLNRLPDVKITRKIVNPKDDSGLELVLFQFQTCPFCCKVRSFLDYHGLSYGVVEVDAVLRQGIKWSDTKKVPIMLARTKTGRYVQLTDSSMIVSVLSSYLRDKQQDVGELAKYYPSISYVNDAGRKANDIMNKYFLMLQDAKLHEKNDAQE